MRQANCPDDEFLAHVEKNGVQATAEAFGYSGAQAVRNRVRSLRNKAAVSTEAKVNVELGVKDGQILVGSDMHYWPNLPPSTAHLAMVRLARELRPSIVVANGDVIDAPSVSKHAAIGWEARPALWDEVLAAQERLGEIEEAAPDAITIWPLGNHDERFETFIANVAGQYRGVQGIHLKDHFPAWVPCYVLDVNARTNDWTVIQHSIRGGATAVTKNMMDTGTHVVTGHVHAANVYAYTNRRGTYYGVDTGTIAALPGPQFSNYTRGKPLNWRSAVTVLTYVGGRLLPPEQLIVLDETKRLTAFRGSIHQEA